MKPATENPFPFPILWSIGRLVELPRTPLQLARSLAACALIGLVATNTAFAAPQTAEARLFSTSVRVSKGNDNFGLYSLQLTMLNSGYNGELIRNWGGAQTHFSYIDLIDEFGIYDPVPGQLGLNVPLADDANDNGWQDFHEVAMPTSTTTSGAYDFFGFSQGSVQASWSRAAGSRYGTCVLTLQSLGSFTHTYEILEYTGTAAYTQGVTQVDTRLNLAQTGDPSVTLAGPSRFLKLAADPANDLQIVSGWWTNQVPQSLRYITELFYRDPGYPTNYYGFIEFDDWDLNTLEADYYTWILSMDDPNDTDKDGIPDFSDSPAAVVRPRLSVQKRPGDFLLTIQGTVGRPFVVQETLSLAAPQWQPVASGTLTSAVHQVSLPLSAAPARFWRATSQ